MTEKAHFSTSRHKNTISADAFPISIEETNIPAKAGTTRFTEILLALDRRPRHNRIATDIEAELSSKTALISASSLARGG
jgi:hypothetical protein